MIKYHLNSIVTYFTKLIPTFFNIIPLLLDTMENEVCTFTAFL